MGRRTGSSKKALSPKDATVIAVPKGCIVVVAKRADGEEFDHPIAEDQDVGIYIYGLEIMGDGAVREMSPKLTAATVQMLAHFDHADPGEEAETETGIDPGTLH